jgi:hypothetical protein
MLMIVYSQRGAAQIFSENFDYITGMSLTLTGGGWTAFSSAGVTPVLVHTSGLTYAGYPNSGIGNAISLQNLSAEDVEHSTSATLATGESIYAAFLIQVASAGTGALVLNFGGNGAACTTNSGFTFRNSSGNLQFGLSNNGSNTFIATNYSFNQPYLIVIEYFSSSRTYSLYVNPTLSGTKPSSNLSITHSCTEITSVSSTRIYQNASGASIIDGLRVSKSWSEVVGASGGGGSVSLLKDENFDYTAGNNISSFSGWTACCGTATVMAGSLSFSTYGSSGVANGLSIVAGAQPELTFMQQSSGSIYAGFLAAGTSTIQAYFDGSGCGSFQSTSQSTPQIPLSANATFIVVEIDLTNRFYYYYMNPPMGASKPAPSFGGGGGWGGACVDYINSLVFEVSSGGAAVDGIRVGTNWSDIVAIETPVNQPTAAGFQNRQSNAVDLYYTQAPDLPSGYLVVRKSGSTPTGTPTDNIAYAIGNTLGDGTVVYSGASTSITDNIAVLPETAYYYSIFSMNSGGSDTKYLTTSPLGANTLSLSAEPSGAPSFGASGSSSSQIELSFSAASTLTNADGYLIYRSNQAINSLSFITDGSAPGSFTLPADVSLLANVSNNATTSANDTGLSPNSTYYYALVPYNFDGTNNTTYNYYTATITGVTGLTRTSAPTATAATIPTKNSFTATWSATTGASSYQLDVSTTSGFGADIISGYNSLVVNGTSQTVSGLNANSTYYYRVRAVNASGASGSSNTVSQLTLTEPPAALDPTSVTTSGFTMNWTAVTGATEYALDISGNPSFSIILEFQSPNPITGTSYTLSNQDPGVTYYYRVRAVNASGPSEYSNVKTAITIPAAPIASNASTVTASSLVANWGSTTGATAYRLDVSDDNFSTILSSYNNFLVNGTSQELTGLSPNTIYYYRVRGTHDFGASASSNIISQLTLTAAPVAQAATAITENSFTMNWTSVTGASQYQLDVSGSPTFSTTIELPGAITGTSHTLSNQPSGTTHYYRVRAVNATGPSENSNTISLITVPAAPVAKDATFITKTSFIANWDASVGAVDYRLDVFDNLGVVLSSYNNLTVSGTSQDVSGLSEGITYTYRVRAANASGTSSNSASISVVTVPPVPTPLAATAISASGFTANWSIVTGATEYLLYVNDGTSPLTGYDPKTLATNSEVISGLAANTTYHYSVKARSSSGTSTSSVTIDVTTLPTAPSSPTVTGISQTGFTANWTSVAGISEYQLDVSQDNFATNISGYDNLTVSATSKTITGLTPGTSYKFRVRAKNVTGGSANSSSVDALLIPATPVANAATTVTASGFNLSWSPTAGISNYVLDVSDKSDFSTFLTGYNQKIIASSTTQEILTALQSGTTYYYRVKSRNASGDSPFSNSVSQITVPGKPVLNIAQQITSSSFQASWPEVTGAASYELDVYTSSDDINITYVTGYQSRSINGTDEVVEGLAASTVYRFRIRAKNAGGVSENSTRLSVQTLTSAGTVDNPPTITAGTPTQPNSVKAVIAGGTSPWIVTLYHKKITGDAFIAEPPSSTTSTTVDFNVADLADELGLEYYFHVVDENAKVGSSPPAKYTVSFEANTRSFVQGDFAGNRSSIKIIAIPFVLGNNAVEAVFGALGAYNKKVWRLAHYSNGKNVEFQSPGFPTIERGLGFWFNANVSSLNLKTTAGNVGPNDSNNPFKLNLNEGWNQIGNPYPFAIDWSDVLTDNTTAATGVGGLRKYRGESQNFVDADDLGVFEGAFVFAESATELEVNVGLKNTFTAGRKRQEQISSDLGENAWELPIKLSQGGCRLELAGIGMHPEALSSKDRFDDIRLPRLDEYLDVTFEHPEYKFSHFSKDIVPTREEYTWTFAAESSSALEGITLEWDNSMFGENSAQLFLLDLTDATVVNMRSQNSYSYNGSEKREFRIYYIRSQKEFSPGICLASVPFPNPARTNVNVNIVLPDAHERYSVLLQIFDFRGKPVKQIHYSGLQGGMHQLQWNTDSENVAAGTYFIRTTINEKPFGPVRRIIVLN